MLGYGYMGRVHSEAYRRLGAELVSICGRSEDELSAAARSYGFERHTTDWRALIADERITLFDNGAVNAAHAEPTIAALAAGKHVVCEKPLGMTAAESHAMWRAAAAAGVTHMCGFNYRFVPAVRRARELVDAGDLGEIHHFRARYLQEWLVDPGVPVDWRLRAETSGTGAIADLGSHVVDLARYLVGEPAGVSAVTQTFTRERPGGRVDVDDAFAATVVFESGAIGTLEGSRVARGRGDDLRFELNGSRASIAFELARINELRVADKAGAGFRTIDVGAPIEWKDTFVLELGHLLEAIAAGHDATPSFEDGYRAAEICEAIVRSAASGRREPIRYR